MADKSNPFRNEELYEQLKCRGIHWMRAWPNGASIDLYSIGDRWLALMVYQSRSSTPWWGVSDHLFTPLRAREVAHPGYLVVALFQDDPQAGTILTGDELTKVLVDCSTDRTGNVKVFPTHIDRYIYLRGASAIAEHIEKLLRGCEPEGGLSPEELIPRRRRKVSRRSPWWARFRELDAWLSIQTTAHQSSP
jgi:hypothetical protein